MINRVRSDVGGFTIAETVIVLAVTSALLLSALLLFQNRVPRTQFANAVNEFETRIQDSLSEVVSGYYPSQVNFVCTNSGDLIPPPVTGSQQGQSENCLFIGQAVQLATINGSEGTCATSSPNPNCDVSQIYTIVGRRLNGGGDVATSLSDAEPRVSEEYAQTSYTNNFGTYVTKAFADYGGGNIQNIGGFAYVQSFGKRSTTTTEVQGASEVELIPLIGTQIGMPIQGSGSFAQAVRWTGTNGFASAANPSGGITICLRSAVTSQYSKIQLGRNGVVSDSYREVSEGPIAGC